MSPFAFTRWISGCFLILALSGLPLAAADTDSPEKPPGENAPDSPESFHLFLLVGQSNMAGRGVVEPQDQKPHPRVLVFTKEQTWAPAVDPLHFDKPAVVGVGPGRAFGLAVAKANPDITIGLIPCARGGSPISSWEPGAYHDQTDGYPYDEAIERARAAMRTGTLRGILWHQGEGDSTPERARVYEKRLHELVERFREDLNAPEVPFIVGQLGKFETRPWNDAKKQVDAIHRDLPNHLPRTAFVSADGLTDKGDHVHFDARSSRELGERFAKAYLTLIEKESPTPTKPNAARP